jgi:hypothetical protein
MHNVVCDTVCGLQNDLHYRLAAAAPMVWPCITKNIILTYCQAIDDASGQVQVEALKGSNNPWPQFFSFST